MITPLLLFGPLLLASPNVMGPEAVAPGTAHLGAPSILTGRKRGYMATERAAQDRDLVEGKPVPVRCKVFAPTLFSGRMVPDKCQLEVIRPEMDTVAPAIFSGRSPKRGNVIVGAAAVSYATMPGRSSGQTVSTDPVSGQTFVTDDATGRTYAAVPEQVYKPAPKRRAPSIFSGRRARPAPSQ